MTKATPAGWMAGAASCNQQGAAGSRVVAAPGGHGPLPVGPCVESDARGWEGSRIVPVGTDALPSFLPLASRAARLSKYITL